MSQILLITDFPLRNDPAIRLAVGLAKDRLASLHVIHREPAKQIYWTLEEKASRGRAAYSIWSDLVTNSSSLHAIGNRVELRPALENMDVAFDLVVFGAKSFATKNHEVLSAVSATIKCPVLVVGPNVVGDMTNYQPVVILHATDFSPQAKQAVQHANLWAEEYQSWMTFLHVVEGTGASIYRERKAMEEPFRKWMAEMVPAELQLWSEVDHRIAYGNPASEILRTADELQADLVVIGNQGMDGVNDGLPGPTALKVIAEARCPVLVVPDQQQEAALSLSDDQQLPIAA
jgi:nucleotide-binding universal stress UspA family protein